MEPRLVRHADVLPVEVAPAIRRRTLAWGERGMLLETTFGVGAELAMHSHPHEQITYVVDGELELRIGDETYTLARGDSVPIPPEVCHGVTAPKRTVVIDTFSPPREDVK